jgi:hypothetical protein
MKLKATQACEILGVTLPEIDWNSSDPSPEDQLQGWKDGPLKKAWRAFAKKYHPDVNKDSGAEAKFKEASAAFEVLNDLKIRDNGRDADRPWTHEDAADAFSVFERMVREAQRRRKAQEDVLRKAERARKAAATKRAADKARREAEERRAAKTKADLYDGPDHAEQLPPGGRSTRPTSATRGPAKASRGRKVSEEPRLIVFPGRKKPPPPPPRGPAVVVIVVENGVVADAPEGIDVAGAAAMALDAFMGVGEMFGLDAALGFPNSKKTLKRLRKLIKS